MNERRMVEAYRAKDSTEAHLLKSALQEAGIQAVVDGDLLQGALGGEILGWPTAPRIMVDEPDAAKAREILEQLQRSGLPGLT